MVQHPEHAPSLAQEDVGGRLHGHATAALGRGKGGGGHACVRRAEANRVAAEREAQEGEAPMVVGGYLEALLVKE